MYCILVIVYFSCATEEKMTGPEPDTLKSEKVARKRKKHMGKKCEDFVDRKGESARRLIRKINGSRRL